MTRDIPRRTSSRAPVSRPRRVAGQGSGASATPPTVESGLPSAESGAPPVESGVLPPETSDSLVETPDSTDESPDSTDETPESTDESPESTRGLATLFESRRVTVVLLGVVAVLALVAGGLFAWDAVRDDDVAKPSKQPVVVSADDATTAVDAAAKSAQTILTRTYQDYDKQVDAATDLMTPAFAKEFRTTTDDVKDKFVADQTDQQVRVVGQGVVHATRTEVQALLFLNYYVSKAGGDTTYTAYRALVTVVNTNGGWLVSGIDTK